MKQASGDFEFGSFCLAGHLRVDGFRQALSKGADGRALIHAAVLVLSYTSARKNVVPSGRENRTHFVVVFVVFI